MPIVPRTPADRVYGRLEPIAVGDEEAGYPLYGLVEALTLPQDPRAGPGRLGTAV